MWVETCQPAEAYGGNDATGMRESGRNGRYRVLATRFWEDHVLKLRLPFDGSVASVGVMRLDRVCPGSSWNLLSLPPADEREHEPPQQNAKASSATTCA